MKRHLHLRSIFAASLLALATMSAAAFAQSPLGSPFGASDAGGYTPRVPVSAFARPWLDPGKLHVASTMSVGTGFAGKTSALQVTSFAYQFTKPAWVQVNVGNALGNPGAQGNGLFLEGLSFGFKPTANTIFQIQYRDFRSPLQYSRDPFYRSGW